MNGSKLGEDDHSGPGLKCLPSEHDHELTKGRCQEQGHRADTGEERLFIMSTGQWQIYPLSLLSKCFSYTSIHDMKSSIFCVEREQAGTERGSHGRHWIGHHACIILISSFFESGVISILLMRRVRFREIR